MVQEVRDGVSLREVARRHGVSLGTVWTWVNRAKGRRLDRVDWEDRPRVAEHVRRTPRATEDLILSIRGELRKRSALGEYGAEAIRSELIRRGLAAPPCVRTVGRILERRGALDGRGRVRRPPPPRGWYVPEVAKRAVELDSFDVVEGLLIRGGTEVEVLNGVSLHGGLPVSWPMGGVSAKAAVTALTEHWRDVGLPAYAQFDNDTRFQGAHQHRDSISRVMRLCLSLGVTPVFAPPQERGFQASVENYNGRWQSKVWSRFQHERIAQLRVRSDQYVAAYRKRAARRIKEAPPRRTFPSEWELDLQRHPTGRVLYLRRTSEKGKIYMLGRTFLVDENWQHRLVRCEVDLDEHRIRVYALRRRAPHDQPCLADMLYILPRRRFHA